MDSPEDPPSCGDLDVHDSSIALIDSIGLEVIDLDTYEPNFCTCIVEHLQHLSSVLS